MNFDLWSLIIGIIVGWLVLPKVLGGLGASKAA